MCTLSGPWGWLVFVLFFVQKDNTGAILAFPSTPITMLE